MSSLQLKEYLIKRIDNLPDIPKEVAELILRPEDEAQVIPYNDIGYKKSLAKRLFSSALSLLYETVALHSEDAALQFFDVADAFPALLRAVHELHILFLPNNGRNQVSPDFQERFEDALPKMINLHTLVARFTEYNRRAFGYWAKFAKKFPPSCVSLIMVSYEPVNDYKKGKPDPVCFWEIGGFTEKLGKFKHIERFSIYTNAYPVQPPDDEIEIFKLKCSMTDDLPTDSRLCVIFIMGSILDEDERCEEEGWNSNMKYMDAGSFGPMKNEFQFGSCYSFVKTLTHPEVEDKEVLSVEGGWRVADIVPYGRGKGDDQYLNMHPPKDEEGVIANALEVPVFPDLAEFHFE
ncbi:hypothetical protein SCHPADRAFT_947987 [Schizopora paradoxa]|uniref:Uncharacterized protein n=1 Tax=Schizopora paradoxa TaxID=27342 RepID=A0A0H2QYN6_9AGAM|nr:hypothetical protein SCHPADRAFT_947987 [Schizopora paradoxa]